jgi:hypothetical protein
MENLGKQANGLSSDRSGPLPPPLLRLRNNGRVFDCPAETLVTKYEQKETRRKTRPSSEEFDPSRFA